MPSPRPQRIALLVDTSVTFSSMIIRGVARYAREQPSWQILVQPRGVHEYTSVPRRWDVDGVITRVMHRAQAAALRRLGIPVVNVSRSQVPGFRFPQVISDSEESARLAAAHLIERGFRSLAYCRIPNQPNYQDRMGPAFAETVRGRGGTCALFTEWRRSCRAAARCLPNWSAGSNRWKSPSAFSPGMPSRGTFCARPVPRPAS